MNLDDLLTVKVVPGNFEVGDRYYQTYWITDLSEMENLVTQALRDLANRLNTLDTIMAKRLKSEGGKVYDGIVPLRVTAMPAKQSGKAGLAVEFAVFIREVY